MENFALIWNFAPDLKIKLLCLAMAGQMAVAIYTYLALSKARVAASKAGRIKPEIYKATDGEPEDLRVLTRAVANQFEQPVIFYALLVAHLAVSTASWITVLLAWAFVLLRLVHAKEMTTTNAVFRRRRIFVRATQVLMVLMVEFVISTLLFAQA